MARFTEADIKAIGGLSYDDRALREQLDTLVPLAVQTTKRFQEALNGMHGQGGAKRWLENCRAVARRLEVMRESTAESAMGFLVRKGVQSIANSWYDTAQPSYEKYIGRASSTTVAEWYAPLYGSEMALQVENGAEFPLGRVVGQEAVLRNILFGRREKFERVLFDDDQTGQIKQRAERLGKSMRVTEGVYAASRLGGAARTYGPLTVPASNWSGIDVNGTAVTTPFATAIGNRPSTFLPLNMGRFKTAYVSLLNIVDPLQNKMLVKPNKLVVSNLDALNADMLTKAGPYPAVPGQSDTAAANAPIMGGSTSAAGVNQGVLAGYPGGAFAMNPMAGLGIEAVAETYLPDWAAYLGEGGKGIICQTRDAMEITQEAPNTGSWFNFDAVQFRSRARWEIDWIEPRYWFQLTDGSATGVN